MKSDHTGLYIQKNSNEKIHTVQIVDNAGNSMPLDAEIYIEREIKPDIKFLPTKEEFESSKK